MENLWRHKTGDCVRQGRQCPFSEQHNSQNVASSERKQGGMEVDRYSPEHRHCFNEEIHKLERQGR